MNRNVRIFPDAEQVAQAALQMWLERLRSAAGPYWVSLAGGTTPRSLYQALAGSGADLSKLHLLWGDERFVPSDHEDSNFRMVREALLDRTSVGSYRAWNILENAEASAHDYESWLRENRPEGVDLCLLGMGDDGHTASLFPDTAALDEEQRWAVENWVEKFSSHRLTLTYPYLEKSQEVMFLITGAGKARALKEVLEHGLHPSSRIRAQKSVYYLVDRAAAAQL